MQGRLIGRMQYLGFQLREEIALQTLTHDVVETSEIEGENLDTQQVRSSVAHRMGEDVSGFPTVDRNLEGIVEVMFDATNGHDLQLTAERLFGWHAALIPTCRSGWQRNTVGAWLRYANGPCR